jgi:hypothetical protein
MHIFLRKKYTFISPEISNPKKIEIKNLPPLQTEGRKS